MDATAQKECGGLDHAGKYETSMLMALYPNMVDLERTKKNTEWFSSNAGEANFELGEKMVNLAVKCLMNEIK